MQTLTLPKALDLFSDHLPEIKQACLDNMEHILDTPVSLSTEQLAASLYLSRVVDVDGYKVVRSLRKLYYKDKVFPLQRTIKAINHRIKPKTLRELSRGVTEQEIENAKEYPIKQLFTEITGGEVSADGMAKCPFHPDKTASLSFRRYNRMRCFGCDAKGSTIDLYMKITSASFIDAVRALQ